MRARNTRRTAVVIASVLGALALDAAPGFGQGEDVSSERPPGETPTRVEVACYVIDLMKVIDRDEAFEADLFILAQWKDPRLAGERVRVLPSSEVWTPNLLVFNQRDASSELPDVVDIQPDGTVTQRRRLIGTFASSFDLSSFPLDHQTLEVRLVLYGTRTDEVTLVRSASFPSTRSPELAITDWEIGELESSASSFEPIPGVNLASYSIRVEAHRLIGYYVVQMLVPLVLIVGMSWVVFWIDPSVIPTRMSVCVTTVLTLIAYRFMVGGLVPKLPYLTLMDYLLLGSTLLVAGSLVTVAIGTYLVKRDRAATVERLDGTARIAFPIAFVLLLASLPMFG